MRYTLKGLLLGWALNLATFAMCVAHAQELAPGAQPRPSEYRLHLDSRLGIESGVVTLTDAFRLGLRGVDSLDMTAPSARGVMLRIFTFIAVDTAVASYANMLPHELFGHGARTRELGFSDSYRLAPPVPYALFLSDGFKNTAFWRFGMNLPATMDEVALLVLGGFAAEEVQLRHLSFTAFRARSLSRGDSLIYLAGPLHLMRSVGRGGGDISNYYRHLRERYGASSARESGLTALSLAAAAADPLLIYSLYSYFYRYLFRGERAVPYPMLRLGNAELSVTNRLLLVPWGREHQLGVLMGMPAGNFDTSIRMGEGPGGMSFGLAINAMDISIGRGVRAVGRLEVFHQPALDVLQRRSDPSVVPMPVVPGSSSRVLGVGGDIGLELYRGRWLVGTRLGAKTAGYQVSQPYASAWTASLTIGTLIEAAN